MKRFQKKELLREIKNYTITFNKKPTVKELVLFINNHYNPEDYITYDDYISKIVNDSIVRKYIKEYNLKQFLYNKNTPQIDIESIDKLLDFDENDNIDYDRRLFSILFLRIVLRCLNKSTFKQKT